MSTAGSEGYLFNEDTRAEDNLDHSALVSRYQPTASNRSASGHQVEHKENHRNDEHEVNEATGDVEGETSEPEQYQDNSDDE